MAHKNTNALALHNLALATAFGGPIFGKIGLGNAVRKINSETERGLVLESAWNKFGKIDLAAHAVFALTWAANRNRLLKAKFGKRTHKLVMIKDALIAGAVITGVANALVGAAMAREFPEGVPVISGSEASTKTPERAVRYLKYFRVMGPVNLALVGASIAIGPMIGRSAVKAVRRSLLKHLFR